jgi:hypothetical protein
LLLPIWFMDIGVDEAAAFSVLTFTR